MLLFMFILARKCFARGFAFSVCCLTLGATLTHATDIIGIIYIIVEEKEREEEQVVAGIGFDNCSFQYGTTVVPTTPLPTITTDNGFEKRKREYGFGFGTVAVVVAVINNNTNWF